MKPLCLLVTLAGLLLAGRATSAEELHTRLSFSGADAGENVFERKADGIFTSKTEVTLAGTKISSVLTGRLEQNRMVAFTLDQKSGNTALQIVFDKNRVKITAGDKTREQELQLPSDALVFANFHPQLLRALPALLQAKTGPETVPLLLVDGAALLKTTLTRVGPLSVQQGDRRLVATEYGFTLTSLNVRVAIDTEGRVLGVDVPAQRFQMQLSGCSEVFVDPTTQYPELSQPTYQVVQQSGVKIRMRDGVELVADLFRPEGEGKFPAILVRTVYGRKSSAIDGAWWAKRGYIYLAQDCRGRHDSGGEWVPFHHERKDGADTLDWICKQPWSDGSVGMIGGSYLGYVQWAAAVERHPALKCIVPQVSPPDPFFNIPFDHGIFFLYGSLWWANIVKNRESDMSQISVAPPHPEKLTTLPLTRLPEEVLGVRIPFFEKWVAMDRPSDYTSGNYGADLAKVTIPALHISGWWDGDGIGTKRNWTAMRSAKRTNQWLLYGPWTHAFNTASRFGDMDYGSGALLELQSLYLRWFDTWLKGKEVHLAEVPRVRVFVTGANVWRDLKDWPDPRSRERAFYLTADGPANGVNSRGRLAEAPPEACEPSRYTYNPAHTTLPKQIRPADTEAATTVLKIEDGDEDQLVYKSEPLKEPLEIGGPIEADLYVSTSARDTDFFATLADIDEKGTPRMIGLPGKLNGRYMNGWKEPKLLTPGKIYRARIELWDTAHRFLPGHRIGLVIRSSMFPSYARNLNTGEPIKDATRMVTAHQTLLHDRAHPSALRFRTLPQ